MAETETTYEVISLDGTAISKSEQLFSLEELIEKVQSEEQKYQFIEVKSSTQIVTNNPKAQPQPGFDIDPSRPTGIYDRQLEPYVPGKLHAVPHHMEFISDSIRQGERLTSTNNVSVVMSVTKYADGEGQKVSSQEYLTQEQVALIKYDGQTLLSQHPDFGEKSLEIAGLKSGLLEPQTGMFEHFEWQPLSEILAGVETSPAQTAMAFKVNEFDCKITGQGTVGEEPVIIVNCTRTQTLNNLTFNEVAELYLASNKNYIPAKILWKSITPNSTGVQERLVESWQEVKPGIWYPQKIVIQSTSDNPEIAAPFQETEYQVVSLEPDYPDEFFRSNDPAE
ncbi:MAG: hypothetical protein R3C11_22150 [Planctomycetaceae bacterium]